MRIKISALLVLLCLTFTLHAQWLQTSCNSTGPIKCFASDGASFYAGTIGNGVFVSPDNGITWNTMNTGLSNTDVRAMTIVDTNIFAGTYGDGVFRFDNTLSNWSAVNNGLPSNAGIAVMGKYNNKIFTGTDNSGPVIYSSINNGGTWTSSPTGVNFFSCITRLDSTLFAGTFGGTVCYSIDSGASWTNSSTGLTSTFVRAIAAIDTVLFVGTDNGVFVSYSHGQNWSAVNNGLTTLQISSLAVIGSDLFAGTFGSGVFYSADNGANWIPFNSGLSESNIYCLASKDSILFAGTDMNHIWKYTTSPSATPDIFTVVSPFIFPNPACQDISIRMPNGNSPILVNIISLQGTLVQSEQIAPGMNSMYVGNLSQGIYIMEIIAAGNVTRQKLIIKR